MIFEEAWTLAQGVHNQFKARIQEYLFDELLGDTAEYLPEEWNRCSARYATLTQSLQHKWQSTCQLPTSIRFRTPLNLYNSQAALNAYVDQHFNIPNIGNVILNCLPNKKYKMCCVYLYLDHDNRSGHATLLFFDLRRKLQWFFDPADHLNSTASTYKAFSRRAYVNGFQVVPAQTIAFANANESIQHHFENINPDQTGTCGVLCIMVLLTCLRFGYYNTKKMSTLIMQAANTPALKRELMRKFISWYDDISRVHRFNLNEIYRMATRAAAGSLCSAYSQTSHRLCSRKSCREGTKRQFCWQHKSILQNPFLQSKKCNAD